MSRKLYVAIHGPIEDAIDRYSALFHCSASSVVRMLLVYGMPHLDEMARTLEKPGISCTVSAEAVAG